MNKLDEHGDPLSPFEWSKRKQPSVFAKDMKFTGRYKIPTSPVSITIKQVNVYMKAKNGNS